MIPGGYPLENPLGITGKRPKNKNFFAMMLNIGLVRNHKEMGKAPNLKREIGSKLLQGMLNPKPFIGKTLMKLDGISQKEVVH